MCLAELAPGGVGSREDLPLPRRTRIAMKPLCGPLPVEERCLKALLALALGDTRNGIADRTTRQMDPSTEPKKSRRRN
jgi:hypothetical protein